MNIVLLQASEKEQIWVLRISTLAFGAMTTAMSIYVKSIYALWVLCSDLVYVILFPQLTCAVYFESTNGYGSFMAFVVAVLLRLAGGENTLGLDPVIRYPWHYVDDTGKVIQLFPHKTMTMLISLTCLLVCSWVTNYIFEHDFFGLDKHKRSKTYEVSRPVTSTDL